MLQLKCCIWTLCFAALTEYGSSGYIDWWSLPGSSLEELALHIPIWLTEILNNKFLEKETKLEDKTRATTHPVAVSLQTVFCKIGGARKSSYVETLKKGQYAFVTTLRTPEYLVLVRELHCSLQLHNHGARFIVAAVEGDLDNATVTEVTKFAEFRLIEDVKIQSLKIQRFSKNWCKLRIFDWVDLDGIIMMDSDMIVQGDLQHLFQLPTDFAWTMDSGPGMDIEQGGFVFLRPCRAMARHMIKLAQGKEELQFPNGFAEQQFLQWYFRYSGYRLSSSYNADFEVLQHMNHRTAEGAKPLVIHFAFNKPFNVSRNDPRYRYLCWQPKQLKGAAAKRNGSSQTQNILPDLAS